MRRLVDRSRTGGRRTGRQNRRCRSTGEDRGNGGKLYRTIFASVAAMSLSRNLGRAISIAAIALAAPAIGQIKTDAGGGTEIAEAARPVDEGVPEVAVYELQKLVTGLSGADAIKAKEKLAEALIAAGRSTEALRLLDEPVLRDSTSG